LSIFERLARPWVKDLQQRQLLAAQWLSQNQSVQQQVVQNSMNKKQREVYVGNLAVGIVNQAGGVLY
jgi:hypothetical protein